MLLNSEVMDFRRRRTGCYILPGTCEWLHLVPRFLRMNIPIGFLYPVLERDHKRFNPDSLSRIEDPHFIRLVGLNSSERQLLECDIKLRPAMYIAVPTPAILLEARSKVGMPTHSMARAPALRVSMAMSDDLSKEHLLEELFERPCKKARTEPKWKAHLEERMEEDRKLLNKTDEKKARRMERILLAEELKVGP